MIGRSMRYKTPDILLKVFKSLVTGCGVFVTCGVLHSHLVSILKKINELLEKIQHRFTERERERDR